MANDYLRSAQAGKNDEFYTQFQDIASEMNAYLEYNPDVFRDKTILLPCDDPEWSNFTKYFATKFEEFGIKKLISTSYAPESKKFILGGLFSDYEQNSPQFDADKSKSHGKIFVLERDISGDGRINIDDLEWSYLEGDGDFRSAEVTKLRNEADIIITNPPFSLFREFLAWIVEANKQFIIIGNVNAVNYKEVFPLIMENKMWIGKRFNQRVNGKNMTFMVPDSYPMTGTELYIDEKGRKFISVAGTGWFTNIEHGKRHEPIPLMTMADNLRFSKHKEIKGRTEYAKYENYDAIDVPFTDAIPSDYDGIMGVPLTFISKYCPEQFDILGITENLDLYSLKTKRYTTAECQQAYMDKFGKKGTYDLNASAVLRINGILEKRYGRILIRKKQ